MKHNINSEISFTYIFSKKKQTLIAALGVTFGIAVFIFMNSMMRGFDRNATEGLFKTAPHLRIYKEDKLSEAFSNDGNLSILLNPTTTSTTNNLQNPEKLIEMLKNHPNVTGVAPEVSANVFYSNGTAQVNGVASGVKVMEENELFNIQSNLVDGSLEELVSTPNGVILGVGIADKLNLRKNDNISVTSAKGVSKIMKIVGLLRTGLGQVDKTKSYIHLNTAQQLLKENPNYITDIFVNLKDFNTAKSEIPAFEALTGYKAESWESANLDAMATSKIRRIMALAISSSILLVAGFGIFNILSMTVMQKMNEIAILKAMGFSGNDVIRIFVQQSLLIGMVGVSIGLILASVLVRVMSKVYVGGSMGYFPIRHEPFFFVAGICFGLFITFIAGYLPAKKAAAVDPVAIFRK
jgi:lipoprotein-releasing system permease protein